MSELIQVKQLPIIEERLRSMKPQIEAKVSEATALICTADNLSSVKATRADLNKLFSEFEEQRKEVEKSILEPLEKFRAAYKENIKVPIQKGVSDLNEKVGSVEAELKGCVEQEMKSYFHELCQAEHVEWLSWEQSGVTISLTDARQKTHKRLLDQIFQFVTGVARGVEAISGMEDAEEIMVEFRRCLDAATAIRIVQERHQRIKAERQAAEARKAALEAQRAAVEKVEAAAPPVAVEPPVSAPEAQKDTKVYKCSFTVRATKEQLKKLKEFMSKEGIKYE